MNIAYNSQETPFWDWNGAWAGYCIFSTTMAFAFELLTASFHFWQYDCKLPKQPYIPILVSNTRVRSIA